MANGPNHEAVIKMSTDNCSIGVTLYLYGDDLDPELVSKKLGIIPSGTRYKGEKIFIKPNHEYIQKTGVWKLTADSDSNILSDHIDKLTSKVGKPSIAFRNIEGVEVAHVNVFIATYAEEYGGGECNFELSKENVVSLAQLDLPVQFTIALCKP
jgi:hypothetical protein